MKNILKLRNVKKIILNPRLVLIRLYYIFVRSISDIAALFGKYKYKYNIIFIAGMPYSATTLVKNMFGFTPGYYTRYTPMPEDVHVNQDISHSAFRYCPKWAFTLFKTHLNPWQENINIIQKNNVKKVVVTYRDLRDVSVARYYRQLNWPKKKTESYYKDYSVLNKEDAINHSISIIAKVYIPWIEGWFEISKKNKNFVHFCKFEDLKTSQAKEFSKMLEFYEIKMSNEQIDKIIDIVEKNKNKVSMEKNLYQSALLPWAFATNFRSGKIGSWKQEFTENNKNYFKKLTGDFLTKYGYEKDNNW